MDIEKLDRQVEQILARDVGQAEYAEIRNELQEKGYNQEELRYMMSLIDDRLLANLESGGQNKTAMRNMILGGVLSLGSLMVILSSYFGNPVPKEISYLALIVFAVGYLVFRNGFRNRKGSN